MKRILSASALWLAAGTCAFGQVPSYPQTLPSNTVVGRLGIGPGPSQAIPFSTFLSSVIGALPTGNVAGPTSSVDGHVAIFDGITGKVIKDGGALPTGDVAGPGSSVDGHVALFNGATGKLIRDGGPAPLAVCQNLETYGGGTSASGAANLAAFGSAVTALAVGNGGCIAFGPGTYTFSAQVAASLPNKAFNLNLRGTGQNSTTLLWPASGGGFSITYNSSNNTVTMSDMSLATGVNSGGVAIGLNQAAGGGGPTFSSFDRLTVGCGGTCGFWSAGLISGGVTGINVTGSTFYGSSGSIGVQCQGQSLGDYTVVMNVNTSTFWNHSAAVLMSNYCQSLFVAQTNIIGGAIGVFVNGTLGIQSNLNVSNSEISLQSGQAILVSQSLIDFQLIGNFLFGLPGQDVISAGAASFGNIVGNSIACTSVSGNGILLQGSTSNILVSGNVIRDCSLGVVIGAGVTKVNVQSNLYNNNGTDVSNSGGGTNTVGGGSP